MENLDFDIFCNFWQSGILTAIGKCCGKVTGFFKFQQEVMEFDRFHSFVNHHRYAAAFQVTKQVVNFCDTVMEFCRKNVWQPALASHVILSGLVLTEHKDRLIIVALMTPRQRIL